MVVLETQAKSTATRSKMRQGIPAPNFNDIFARRPDLEPPGYKESVANHYENQKNKVPLDRAGKPKV